MSGSPTVPAVPARIRTLRTRLGLSQERLAARIGVSFSTLNAWENGARSPSDRSLRLLAAVEDADEDASSDGPSLLMKPLPVDLTPYRERVAELAALESAWRSGARWLTLTGPGGVGKTRTAIELVRRVGDTVLSFVALDDVQADHLLYVRIASDLGLDARPDADPAVAVIEALRQRAGVVVLDTCEFVADAVASFAGRLLSQAPGVRVIATSQIVLSFPGERVFRLLPLDVDSGGSAVSFFIARARDVEPGFDPVGHELDAVKEICVRSDGLPMALEIAAMWMRSVSPAVLLSQWSKVEDLADSGSHGPGGRRLPRAAIDRSGALLSEPDRQFLATLSLFSGPFSFDDVDTFCQSSKGQSLPTVNRLVDASWLQYRQRPIAYYDMLQGVRAWGRRHLAELSGIPVELHRRRYAEQMLNLTRRAEQARFSSGEGWPMRLTVLRASIDTTLGWAVSEDPSLGVALATSLLGWWRRSNGLSNARHWLMALRHSGLAPLDGARCATAEALVAMDVGRYREVDELTRSALEVLRPDADSLWRARALTAASSAAKYHGDPNTALVQLEEARRLLADGFNQYELAVAYNNLGALAAEQGQLDTAVTHYEQSLLIKRELGDERSIALGQANLADAYSRLGRRAEADEELDAGMAIAHRIDDQFLETFITINRGEHLLRTGNAEQAETTFVGAYQVATALKIPRFRALAACGAGQALIALNQHEEGLRRLRESRSVAVQIGDDIVLRQVREALTKATGNIQEIPPPRGLTSRELQVLQHVLDGQRNKDIAEKMFLSGPTVNSHLGSVYRKFDVHSRTEAIGVALSEGLRPTPARFVRGDSSPVVPDPRLANQAEQQQGRGRARSLSDR